MVFSQMGPWPASCLQKATSEVAKKLSLPFSPPLPQPHQPWAHRTSGRLLWGLWDTPAGPTTGPELTQAGREELGH